MMVQVFLLRRKEFVYVIYEKLMVRIGMMKET